MSATAGVLSGSRARRMYVPWGTLAAIDLHDCDAVALADPDCIRAFVPALAEAGAGVVDGDAAAASSPSDA